MQCICSTEKSGRKWELVLAVGWEGYLVFYCFCMSWKGATCLRCEGQTGLISLQRPLKFLPWDINEVIHRQAAAHHTTPPPLPNKSTSIPLAPLLFCDSTREGQCFAREEARGNPPPLQREHDSSGSMASEREVHE